MVSISSPVLLTRLASSPTAAQHPTASYKFLKQVYSLLRPLLQLHL